MSERSEFAGRPPPVREAQVTDRRSRSGERFGLCFLLVTLISHSAAEERFFAQAKKSDSPKPRSGWRKLLLRGSAGACFCPWLQLQSRTREQTRAEGRARQSKAKPRSKPVSPPPLRGYGELLLPCSCKELAWHPTQTPNSSPRDRGLKR